MTDEIEKLAMQYVTSFGDGADARIDGDIAWAKSTLDWNEVQRLQRAQYSIRAFQQREHIARKSAADFADRQARFVPGLTVRALDAAETKRLLLIAA